MCRSKLRLVAGCSFFIAALWHLQTHGDMLGNVAINFWGRILDQSGQPVAKARVALSVRQWHSVAQGSPYAIFERRELTTDSEGRFAVHELSGDVLSLESVEMNGYRLSDKAQRFFAYSQSASIFHPDSQKPVVIHMWKLGPAEKLVYTSTLYGFQPDGRSYTLDLLTKTKTEGNSSTGDLVFRFTRGPVRAPRTAYPWSLEISALGGGLLETKDEQTYSAPETGYQPKLKIQFSAGDTNWTPSLAKDFYISTRKGTVYGSVHMQIESNYHGQSAILVEARANPNGSRNLQP